MIAVLATALTAAAMLVATAPTDAEAAPAAGIVSAADFDPGLIISDGEFFDGAAMTETEIQNFLVSKVGSCANANCLAVFRMSTPSKAANDYCAAYNGAANESAARIIAKVQAACNISAKAILVTLHKEQGLIGKSAPSDYAIRSAMGYGCPDTAACDSTYYGFFNQVYQAARQFQRYANSGGFTWYPIGTPVAVRYHPNAACGAQTVVIKNKATAGLYYYTPYTPNAAALANLGGTGDACSSYGNRNFWYFYNSWFPSYDHAGRVAMDAAYTAAGGAGGALGAKIGELNSFSANGGGMVQGYANGAITWSQSSRKAVMLLSGPMRDAHRAAGGITGTRLGWPAGNQSTVTQNAGGIAQGFQFGAVAWSEEYGSAIIAGGLRTTFNAAGGLSGAPGFPIAANTSAGGVQKQVFEGGKAYWSNTLGGTFVATQLFPAYDAAGGIAGTLGPASGYASTSTDHGGGVIQGFRGGALAWSADNGAQIISGGIRTTLSTAGGIALLGWPTAGAVTAADGTVTQAFEDGTVSWSPKSGGSFSITAIDQAAAAASLGAPTGNSSKSVAAGSTGVIRAYAGGAVAWTPATGAHAISGGVRSTLSASGGIGSTGWPTADAATSGGVTTQKFQNGTIFSHATAGGAFIVTKLADAYAAAGGLTGSLGTPTGKASESTLQGGGLIQGFRGGAIAWSQAGGAHVISGGIRTTLGTAGGIGVTGWPTTDATTAGGVTSQKFQKGTISWHATAGSAFVVSQLADAYAAAGGLTGSLGTPTGKASESTLAGGGLIQGFRGGAIAWSQAGGAHVISGGIRTTLGTAGGIGVTGWPTTDATTAGGVTTQQFQNGTITWSAGTGGTYTPR